MCPPLTVQIFPSSIRKHEWFQYVNVAWGYLRLLRAPFLSCLVQMCQQGNLFVPLFLTSYFSYLSTITFDLPFLISIFFKYACADMGDIFVSQLLSLDSYLPVFWTKQFFVIPRHFPTFHFDNSSPSLCWSLNHKLKLFIFLNKIYERVNKPQTIWQPGYFQHFIAINIHYTFHSHLYSIHHTLYVS